jgi:hypothetical protein
MGPIGKAISAIVQIIIVIIGGGWAFTLWQAQTTCSLIQSIGPHCTGGKGEIWMLPIFTAPFGIPALIASVVIVGAAVTRKRVS